MDAYKPLTGSCSYPWESEEGFNKYFISWANRDSHNTPTSASIPMNVRAVGESWAPYYNQTVGGGGRQILMLESTSTPPIVVLDLFQMVAPASYKDNKWVDLLPADYWEHPYRDICFVNRVDSLSFEPIDLQWVNEALQVALFTPLAFLFKCLDCINLTANVNNEALKSNILLNALGVYSLGQPTDPINMYGASFDELVRYINTEIIENLNQYLWCYGLTPSLFRGPGIISKFIKETADNDNYTTLYTFKLPRMPRLSYCPDTAEAQPYPNCIAGTYMMSFYEMPTDLWAIARAIKNNLTFLLQDQDFRNITTTMQTIVNKGDGSLKDGIELTKGVFDNYPYWGRPVFAEYNPALLLAIHNATIVPITYNPVATVADPSSWQNQNMLVQKVEMDYSSGSDTRGLFSRQYLRNNAPFDMPAAWNPEDWQLMIAAGQWKIMSYPEQSVSDYSLSPKVLGREVITGAHIWHHAGSEDSQVYYGNPLTDMSVETILLYSKSAVTTQTRRDQLRSIVYIAQCSAFPLTPVLLYDDTPGSTEPAEHLGFATDISHISFCHFRQLQRMKEQMWRNAIGYPLVLPGSTAVGDFMGMSELSKQIAASKPNVDNAKENVTGDGAGSPSGSTASIAPPDSTDSKRPPRKANRPKDSDKTD